MSRRSHQPADPGAVEGAADGLARALETLSSDIALLVDAQGIVTAVAERDAAPIRALADRWVGLPWANTVTGESRRKIASLLADAHASGLGRRREVNHASAAGVDVPVAYAVLRLGERGPMLAVGRDLRSVAAIQHRYLDSQQALERSYWRARHDEARRRLLAQAAMDAVITVDARSARVVEFNPAAARLLRTPASELSGLTITMQFDARSRPAMAALLADAQAEGHTVERRARLAGSHAAVRVSAGLLPAGEVPRLLVRLRQLDPHHAEAPVAGAAPACPADDTCEGVVITDAQGRIRDANAAFVQMVRAVDLSQLQGSLLSDCLPAEGDELVEHVRRSGVAPARRRSLRRRDGALQPVLLSGALLCDLDTGCAAFTLRPLSAERPAGHLPAANLVQALDELSAGLGQEALPVLVRRVQLQAQAHLVQTALNVSDGDPPTAAQLLGIEPEFLARLQRELDAAPPPR